MLKIVEIVLSLILVILGISEKACNKPSPNPAPESSSQQREQHVCPEWEFTCRLAKNKKMSFGRLYMPNDYGCSNKARFIGKDGATSLVRYANMTNDKLHVSLETADGMRALVCTARR